MQCEICHQNQATIHIQEIINSQKKVLHICAACAAKKSAEDPMLQGFNVAEMLYNLSGQLGLPAQQTAPDQNMASGETELICPECGWQSADFRRTGRLGCQECYHVFGGILKKALKTMHRGVINVGKTPAGKAGISDHTRRTMELLNLQKELEELVRHEEYEKAATIRDKINQLKQECSEGKETAS